MARSPVPAPPPFATASLPGLVSTTTQSLAGNKTLTGSVTISANSTTALTVGTNSLIVNSTSGFVGINKTTPTVALDVVGSGLITRPNLGAALAVKNTINTGGSVVDFYNFADTLVGSFGVLNTANTETNPGHAFFYTNTSFDFQIRSGAPGSSSVTHAFKADGSFAVGGNTSTSGNKLTVNGKSDFTDILGLPHRTTGALPSAASFEGYVVYDSTTNEFKYSDGTAWVAASGGGGGMSIGGTVTSGTVGSILFVGTGPVLAQDNTNLFWDDTNNRLGIGTSTPSEALDITGNVRFSGALMPNNLPGTSGQVLQSNGAGASPTWVTNSPSLTIGTSISSSTIGSILFVNGSNALGQDNANLFWDDTSNFLGIRTTAAPDSPLHIIGSTTSSTQHWASAAGTGGVYLTTDGANSGFISSGVSLTSGNWTARATDAGIYGYSTGAWRWYTNASLTNGNTYTPTERMNLSASTGNLTVDTNTFVVDAANNRVGVVTASPSEALEVTGNVRFSGALMPNNLPGTSGQILQSNGAGASPTWVTNSASIAIGGTVTSGTTGSLLFIGAASALAQDNANLFWDDTNNRLAIKNTSPVSTFDVTGETVTTQATGFTSGINIGGTFTKNDGNIRTFQVLNVNPTMNFGGTNGGTTIDVIKVDVPVTSLAGATLNYLKLSGGGTTRALFDVAGHLSINSNGAVAPAAPIDIKRVIGSAGPIALFNSGTAGPNNGIEISATSSPTVELGTAVSGTFGYVGTKSGSSNPFVVRTNGTDAITVNATQQVGIGVTPFGRFVVQGAEEFIGGFRSTGNAAKFTWDSTGSYGTYTEVGYSNGNISANTGGFGSYIFTGSGFHSVFGTGDGATARPGYLKVDGDAVIKIDTDRRMKLANAMALGPLTTTNRDALTTLQNGEIIWNTTNTKPEVYTGSAWVAMGLETTTSPSVLSFGATSSANTVTTEYIWPGYGSAASATEIGIVIPSAGKISRLYIKAATGPAGDSIVYTVRKNGTDQALTATLAIAGTSANSTTNPFTVAAGDEITIKSAPNAGLTTGAVGLRISVQMTIV